jgi:hypothetical protein
MTDSHRKSTGTEYTRTVALLVLAFLFSPAILIVSGQFGYWPVSLALASSALCVALAWVNWTRYSQLTIPSLETRRVRPQ